MFGFETIGNATVTCYDNDPIISTDPWITDSAYFGSWTLGAEIPAEQLDAILRSKYIWFSHGHPDHLNSDSLVKLSGKTILLPDHVGGRIAGDLRQNGFSVEILPDRKWIQLSPRIKVLSISDYFQDGILLIDMGQVLVMNINDAGTRGHTKFIRQVGSRFKSRVLLKTFGYGDIDMMNFFTPDGNRITPGPQQAAKDRGGLGHQLAFWGKVYNATDIVPFSSFHEYQRSDSIWASAFTASPDAFYRDGKIIESMHIHPAYMRWDISSGIVTEIRPKKISIVARPPEDFGDNWNDQFDSAGIKKVKDYFLSIDGIWKIADYVEIVVGGVRHEISRHSSRRYKGIRFEVPMASLLTAVQYQVFDDLLIGNFMKTTFVGAWTSPNLDKFGPIVGRFADNGLAKTESQLSAYMAEYRSRYPLDFFRHRLELNSERAFRAFFANDSRMFRLAKKVYSFTR